MAGKTAPASLMRCMHDVYSRPDCVSMPGVDGNVAVMKPYSSAPNIDLLQDAEPRCTTRSNEAEDVLQLQEVKPDAANRSVDKQLCTAIPEIVVVYSNDDDVSSAVSSAVTHQPDIVQSTKPGSLPRQQGAVLPMQPVAPPRRKKTKTPSPSVPIEVFLYHLTKSLTRFCVKFIECLLKQTITN